MEREIKFRGKRVDNGEWVYGVPYFIKSENVAFIINNCQSLHLSSIDSVFQGLEVIPETIGQFTGLMDKDNKEIYEGDIIKLGTDKPMVISWSKKFASFVLNRDGWAYSHWFGESCEPDHCEIIGNIYENPELINQNK